MYIYYTWGIRKDASRNALHGLKQASRVWHIKLNQELKRMGLKRSKYNTCVCYKIDMVAVFVDDFLLFLEDHGSVNAVKQ